PELVKGYDTTLDITGTGIMGYIDIDRIGVELPIYHTVDDSVLSAGAGHLEGTSLPIGGASTHCVLSGHRGLPSAKLFTDLDELEVGDEFTITVLDQKLTYRIDRIKTVKPSETEDLQIESGKDYCTLMTCTPYGINSHRLLLRGVRVETAEEKPGIFVKNEAFRIDPLVVTPIVAVPMLVAALVFVLVRDHISKKKKKLAKEAGGSEETQ
ncbi:MAG: class C sortase, partial [Ruminococcus sp.]|nr:class C sortase [Ruminococcus sp.]